MRRTPSTAVVAFALGLALVAAAGIGAAAASPTDDAGQGSGLIDALSRVPDDRAAREGIVGYVDYRAVEGARPGAAQPGSFAELEALRAADDPSLALWVAATRGIMSGSGDLLQVLLRAGAQWPELLGFDFFEIDRELAFGAPPADGTVLTGRFDADAIRSAFEARGYSAIDAGERTLWCPPAGCDAGMDLDFDHIDPADPFGGSLGRRQPIAVSATDLLSSASDETIASMIAAAAGGGASLAGNPAYRAAAGAVDPEGLLIQATFVPGALLAADVAGLLLSAGSPDEARAALEELAATFEPIGPYQLALIADGATATEQVVTIALVYDQEEDAALAAEVIPRRLATMGSEAAGTPWSQLLDERGVSAVKGQVVRPGDGTKAVAAITLRAPLAGDEPDPDSGLIKSSSVVYRLVVDAIYRRDTLWLAPTLPDLE